MYMRSYVSVDNVICYSVSTNHYYFSMNQTRCRIQCATHKISNAISSLVPYLFTTILIPDHNVSRFRSGRYWLGPVYNIGIEVKSLEILLMVALVVLNLW